MEERPQLREVAENERLLAVLRQGTFEFQTETLDKFIYLSAPLTVEAPPEAPPEAEAEEEIPTWVSFLREVVEEPTLEEVPAKKVEAEVVAEERFEESPRGKPKLTELEAKRVADLEARGTVAKLVTMIGEEGVSLRGRIAAAEALGRLGDPRLDEMVEIPAGEFIMGEGDEQRRVFVDAFRIGKYPVTNVQYKAFADATGHRAPSHWREGTYSPDKANHPVVNVSWHDAGAYCRWLSETTGQEYWLPTEEEWEKAASWDAEKGVKRTYPWGDQFDASLCNTSESGIGDTTPVGVYPGGASPYGVMDMAGNVWEWTATEESERERGWGVAKGGSWANRSDSARAGSRSDAPPDIPAIVHYRGFRVCARRSPPAVDN